MKVSNFNVRLKRLAHPPKHTTVNSPYILRTYANMILRIVVTQEIMKIHDPNDTIIPLDSIKDVREIDNSQQISSKDTGYEDKSDFETNQIIFLIAHVDEVFFA